MRHWLLTAIAWIGVAGWAVWGWRKMRKHPAGAIRLAYWIATLLLIHAAAAGHW